MKNTLTKIGLTGNSGMFPCTTSSNGKVVEVYGVIRFPQKRKRHIGNLCRIIDGKLVVFKAVMA